MASIKSNDLTFGGALGGTYASPFNDIAKKYLPSSQRELFRWCQYYLDNSPIIQQAIRRMSSYPVTKILPLADGEKGKERAEDVLQTLRVRDFCQNIAMQYFAFGNSFATIVTPYKRVYQCSGCNEASSIIELEAAQRKSKLKGSLFRMKRNGKVPALAVIQCPKCSVDNAFVKLIDRPVKNLEETRIVLMHPLNIRIDKNPISGKCEYRFVMPADMRKKILQGDKFLIETSPKIFVDAAVSNKDIVMNEDAIYHFCRTNADSMTGWGHPLIQGVLKELFHSQVIKKAAEALAVQHINPLMLIYPKDSGQSNIYQHLDMANWSSNIEGQIKKWRRDPNHVPIMPVPTGVDYIGGQYRSLDPTPALQHINEEIAMGMGVPKEFLLGGTSFSGSSIALRMLENDFVNLRTMLTDFINNFLIPSISRVCDISKFEVKFSNLRTADDVQQKDLMLRLMQMGKMSTETVLNELGFDFKKESDQLYEEMKKGIDANQDMQNEEMGQPILYDIDIPLDGSGDGMLSSQKIVDFMGYMMNNSPPDAQEYYNNMMQAQAPNIHSAVTNSMLKSQGGESPSKDSRPNPEQRPPRRNNPSV
jgi:hypothetical protein